MAASYNLDSLKRTEHIKFTTYQGDGSGRDSYIIFNDGGLIPAPSYNGQAAKCDYLKKSHIAGAKPSQYLCKPNQAVYYPPDGTGRDGYIIKNHGGTCNEDFAQGGIDFKQNNYLRDEKHAPFATPKMDKRLLNATAPQMRTYNNWPSKQTFVRNQELYKKQQEQMKRLSPSTIFYKEQSRFGGTIKKRGSFFKDYKEDEFNEMIHDPVALAVEEGRAKQRALSTLKTTKNMNLVRQPVLTVMARTQTVDVPTQEMQRLASMADRNVSQKFMSSLRGGAIGQNFLVPGQQQPPRTASNVQRSNMQFNQSVSHQNRLLMDIARKRTSFGGSLNSPGKFNQTMGSTNLDQSRQRSSRNSGLQSPAPHAALDFDTPVKRTQSQIKRGQVTRAAYPNVVGMTPMPSSKDRGELFSTPIGSKRKGLDIYEKRLNTTGFNMTRDLDSPDRRRMNPQEYRGPNLSDCMYHTMQGFKTDGARNRMRPTGSSPDANFPATGVQAL